VDGHDLEPGLILAGRYRLEDLVGEVAGARTWRAMDTILNRSVGIQVLDSSDPRTTAFLGAARQSTAVPDPRFLRVLDAVADESGTTYVVREWTRAVPLAALLREGPLRNRRAAIVVGEVAEAMARAHEAGVYHRRIDPATILVKDNDAVRITGLGTDHALHTSGSVAGHGLRDDGPRDPGSPETTGQALHAEQVDVDCLGRLLYACLVARWPGGRDFGLAPAPTEHGRLLRPRQVRAGVSRDVDSVCDRILGNPPRNHAPPLRSARDIASALMLAGEDEYLLTDTTPSLVGQAAVVAQSPLAEVPTGSRPSAGLPGPAVSGGHQLSDPPPGRRPVIVARALVAMGIALLVAIAAVLAFFVGRNTAARPPDAGGEPASGEPASPAAVASRPLPAKGVSNFDPQGDLTENPEAAPYAIDGRSDTSWTTSPYANSPKFGGLKNGVGLLVDLGAQEQVTGVDVSFGAGRTRFQVWAAPAGTAAPPSQLAELRKLGGGKASGDSSQVAFDAVTTRFVLVWLTSLPEEAPGLYRGVVRDISVQGTA
jgi:putative peptidoglycan lipid II flippase